MFEEDECPMSKQVVEKYKLNDKFIKRWCELGCCPICGPLLKEYLDKREKVKKPNVI